MKNKHLSILGVGPIYVSTTTIMTLVIVFLNINDLLLVYELSETFFLFVIGIILIVIGIILWISAVIVGNLISEIKNNNLVTNGVFAIVRNPIYSACMFISSGIILFQNNVYLFIVPVLFYLYLTILLINTEEKWLKSLYKEEYENYCKNVNRCIPMFKAKNNNYNK